MKQLILLLFLFFAGIHLNAQELLQCGADEMRIETLRANPKIAKAVIKRDAELEAFTRQYANLPNRGGQVYTIPVVFHIIHKYGNENISSEQVHDGLRVLNETFRKTRPDTADVHPDFKSIHADTEIQFALATKDPEGNCHSGINRIASDLTNSGDHRVKDLIHWDPSMYLNVYVVTNAAGLAGHCVWPADADTIPQWDGVVISHSYVGAIGTSDVTRSVTFAHECGHYLNLHHIWGGNNVPEFYYLPVGQQSNCNEDDLVDDTPNTIGWSVCNLNAASCGNVRDNVQNMMEYTYCNIMFTEGQKTRMRAALNSPIANRNNLWTEGNLLATGVTPQAALCAADFEANNTLVCDPNGETITFSNTSYHGEIDSLHWEFPGSDAPFSVMDEPMVVYIQPGVYDVSLTVYSNGQSQQVTKAGYITVLQDSSWSYPLWDWFEGNSDLAGMPWTQHSLDAENAWEITEVASHSPSHSIWVDTWENETVTVDELYGPALDLRNASQMKLAFKYAYATSDVAPSGSKLQIQVSRNCQSNWVTRLNLMGSSLETAAPQPEPFVPTIEQWQQQVVNIPSSYFEDGFRFRFVFTSNGKNRLFLDDINVDVTASVENSTLPVSNVSIYPNPTTDILNLAFELEKSSNVRFSVIDVLGKTLSTSIENQFSSGMNTYRLDVERLRTGLYLLQIEVDGKQTVKRFTIF